LIRELNLFQLKPVRFQQTKVKITDE